MMTKYPNRYISSALSEWKSILLVNFIREFCNDFVTNYRVTFILVNVLYYILR